LLHAGGFFLGYVFARLLRYDTINCRTISIEVGMQNSGLGAALAGPGGRLEFEAAVGQAHGHRRPDRS
jgi:predicted Na+-dependent transporter